MDQTHLKSNGCELQGDVEVALRVHSLLLTRLLNRNVGVNHVTFSNRASNGVGCHALLQGIFSNFSVEILNSFLPSGSGLAVELFRPDLKALEFT